MNSPLAMQQGCQILRRKSVLLRTDLNLSILKIHFEFPLLQNFP
jgi:hypothetical protein